MLSRRRKVIVTVVSIVHVIVALYTAALATVFSLIDDEELQVVHMLEVKGQNAITALDVKDLS